MTLLKMRWTSIFIITVPIPVHFPFHMILYEHGIVNQKLRPRDPARTNGSLWDEGDEE